MLTRKQMTLLEFIDKRIARDGVPPSFEEMKDALSLRSKSGVHRLITALEERGFIRRLPHKARAMEVIKRPDELRKGFFPEVIEGDRPENIPSGAQPVQVAAMELPMMGQIAAGVPIEAIQNKSHSVAVPLSMLGQGEHYALEVKGDSMIDIGINSGDVVVIRETIVAEEGDIVVALVRDQEATLKIYRNKGEMIALEAANPSYETRIYPANEIKVQGTLAGLIRTY